MHPQLLKIDAGRAMLGGVSKATWYRLIEQGHIPKPIKIGSGSFWPRQAIEDYVASKLKEVA